MSYEEAAAVSEIPHNFFFYSPAGSFNEFQYFTGVTTLEYAFEGCFFTSITLPETITEIGEHAFFGSHFTSIQLPASVERIGENAFGSKYLESIHIPAGVSFIDAQAFKSCFNLTSITVSPDNLTYDSRDNCNAIIETATNTLISSCTNTTIPSTVTRIGNYAFYGRDISNLTIPFSILTIGDYAFSFCHELTSVTIPSSVSTIGNSAFENCGNLTSILIPSSVTALGKNAFSGCSALADITIPSSIEVIPEGAFVGCSGLTQIVIPDGITGIGRSAFVNSGLTSVSIPSSVTNIENAAFGGCSKLESVFLNSVTPPAVGDNAFLQTSCIIYVPRGYVDTYKVSEGWSYYADRIQSYPYIIFEDPAAKDFCVSNWDTNGDGKLSYEEAESATDGGFYLYSNDEIKSFNEFKYFTNVEYFNIMNCSQLTSIELPSSIVQTPGSGGFSNCNNLISVILPSNIERIREFFISDCGKLKRLDIPSSVTEIKTDSIFDNPELVDITIHATTPPTVPSDGDMFPNNNANLRIYVPAASVEAYKAAPGWNAIASQIVAIAE